MGNVTEDTGENFRLRELPSNGIFYEGNIWEARSLIDSLIKGAKFRIGIIDNKVDDSILQHLDQRQNDVVTTVYTSFSNLIIRHDIAYYNNQHEPVKLRFYQKEKDNFLIIDDIVYHLGGSFKDISERLFSLTPMKSLKGNELIARLKAD